MSRIGSNIDSLTARRALITCHASLNHALEQLSTGLRIHSGRDDRTRLIATEAQRTGHGVRFDGSPAGTLEVVRENATAAQSTLRDADFVRRMSALSRAHILANSSTTVPQTAVTHSALARVE